MKPLHTTLLEIGACNDEPTDAVPWSRDYGRAYKRAWLECERGDWLLWLLARLDIDQHLLVRAACACARTALQYVPGAENRPRVAIETAERWCDGNATIDDVRNAAAYAAAAANAAAYAAAAANAAAYAAAAANAAAANAADAAAYAAAYAAAAANAAAAAAYADAYDAYAAADAANAAAADAYAYAAADAADAAAADADAYDASLRRSADIVRGIIDWPTVRDAAKKQGLMS